MTILYGEITLVDSSSIVARSAQPKYLVSHEKRASVAEAVKAHRVHSDWLLCNWSRTLIG